MTVLAGYLAVGDDAYGAQVPPTFQRRDYRFVSYITHFKVKPCGNIRIRTVRSSVDVILFAPKRRISTTFARPRLQHRLQHRAITSTALDQPETISFRRSAHEFFNSVLSPIPPLFNGLKRSACPVLIKQRKPFLNPPERPWPISRCSYLYSSSRPFDDALSLSQSCTAHEGPQFSVSPPTTISIQRAATLPTPFG